MTLEHTYPHTAALADVCIELRSPPGQPKWLCKRELPQSNFFQLYQINYCPPAPFLAWHSDICADAIFLFVSFRAKIGRVVIEKLILHDLPLLTLIFCFSCSHIHVWAFAHVHYSSNRSHTIQSTILAKNIFAQILRVCKFSARGLGWRNMWDPPVGGGWVGGHVWWCKQRDRPARHPATHLLIFSDEDFYLRLILYSFQPACIVSLQPPSLPRQPGWRQHFAPNMAWTEVHSIKYIPMNLWILSKNWQLCLLKCM